MDEQILYWVYAPDCNNWVSEWCLSLQKFIKVIMTRFLLIYQIWRKIWKQGIYFKIRPGKNLGSIDYYYQLVRKPMETQTTMEDTYGMHSDTVISFKWIVCETEEIYIL